jgi:hypothetical protein
VRRNWSNGAMIYYFTILSLVLLIHNITSILKFFILFLRINSIQCFSSKNVQFNFKDFVVVRSRSKTETQLYK